MGSNTGTSPFLSVFLDGPADDLHQIAVMSAPARSIGDAGLARVVLRASVPAAQDWFAASFAESPDFEMAAFGRLTVGWGRDVDYMHGYRLSMLTVDTGPVLPKRTPVPTRAPTPAPTEAPDPIGLLPAVVRGVSMDRRTYDLSQLPDDQACLPLCRREVEAFAKELGIDPASLSIAVARADHDPTFRFAVAIIRVPLPTISFLSGQWTNGLKRNVWPDLLADGRDYSGKLVEVVRKVRPLDPTARTIAWYVRSSGSLLYVASDAAAGMVSSPPSATIIEDVFGQLP